MIRIVRSMYKSITTESSTGQVFYDLLLAINLTFTVNKIMIDEFFKINLILFSRFRFQVHQRYKNIKKNLRRKICNFLRKLI